MPAWLCSSSSMGCGQPSSTASLNRCRDPTPGLPPQEKTSRSAAPTPIIWSYKTSGVIRTSVRWRRVWRRISCPAAYGIRWVNPSSATVSPSRSASGVEGRDVRVDVDPDGLGLRVLVHRLEAHLPPKAGQADTTKRRSRVDALVGVDPDHAGAQVAGDPV